MDLAWTKEGAEVTSFFNVDPEKGLSEGQVKANREKYGLNEVQSEAGTPFWKLILEQFDDQLVKILLAAAFISFILACFEDSEDRLTAFVEPLVIGLILIANAAVGVIQETNAEKAIEALKHYEPEKAVCLRDGALREIEAKELVPGDIVEVAVGSRIPADCRLLEKITATFRVDQSILTGESVSVSKTVEPIPDAKCVAQEKTNLLFAGTFVAKGKSRAIVVQTARDTAMGKIGELIATTDSGPSPLQKKLDDFGDLLSKVITVICIIVWLINIGQFGNEEHGGWVRGAIYYFKIAVALAVAAIPEGLPAVVTTCLALGTMKMAKKNAIVRTLNSVETLGCTTVICSDKTGTLTTNKMSVQRCMIVQSSSNNGAICQGFEVTGTDFSPFGEIHTVDESGKRGVHVETPCAYSAMEELGRIFALCNESSVHYDEESESYMSVGEPTEVALKVLSEKIGLPLSEGQICKEDADDATRAQFCSDHWSTKFKKIATLEFSRDRKSMSVLVKESTGDRHQLMVKGAPESILERCAYVRISKTGEKVPLTDSMKASIRKVLVGYSSRALRVLAGAIIEDAAALHQYDFSRPEEFIKYEQNMTFVGMAGMIDPPREEVKDAIHTCRTAGIRVIVITGDNKLTAEAICKNIGIFADDIADLDGHSYTGREFDELSEEDQIKAVGRASLFSRTEPSHKNRLVALLQAKHHDVVAMTGDGVNDAPALKKADIGVAMGSGTAVAKGASDMVLADDNFATIVTAVEEGRAIYNNTKQFIRYLISSNIGEVACIFMTAATGMPEALIPVQLLWVNLVTDGLPATALGFNLPDSQIMKRPPRGQNDPIVNGWLFLRYMVIGIYIGIGTVGSFAYWYMYYSDGPQISWETLTHFTACNPNEMDCSIFDDRRPSTVSLSVLVTIEMFNALNSLSEDLSILQMPPWTNPFLILGVALSFVLHFLIVYVPFFAGIFQVAPICWAEWKIVLLTSLPIIVIDELFKLLSRMSAVDLSKEKRD